MVSDLAREFIKKNKDRIVAEPSGKTLPDLEKTKIQNIRILD